MQKAVVHIRAVLGRILFIGLSVQIVFGLLWLCCSFTGVQWFAESTFYEAVSESLLCDEYTGILYPFLLMLTRRNYTLVCLFQLAVAVLAGFYFLKAAGVKNPAWRIWGSFVLLTYPMALQCHMAVLPNSLTFSCFLFEMAFALRIVGKESKCRKWKMLGLHIAWLGAALFTPSYLYLGAVPVVVLLIYEVFKAWKPSGKRICYHVLLSAVFAGLIVTITNISQQEGAYGRGSRNFESALFQRVVWSGLTKYYMDWPGEVQDTFTTEEFFAAADYPENMILILQPRIEAGLGVDAAREWYVDISKHVFKNNYYQIAYEVLWDGLGNTFPPVVANQVLAGRGYSSYCARNYEVMRQECPALTGYYMDYTAWWFVAGIVIAAIVQLLGLFKKHKRKVFQVVLFSVSAGAMIIWYTMCGAGLWDYKNTLFVGAMWLVWMMLMAVKSVEEEL